MKYRIDRSDIRTVAKVTLSRKRELPWIPSRDLNFRRGGDNETPTDEKMALACTEFEVDNVPFQTFTLPDRRPTACSSQPVKWLYQMDLESFLYNHDEETQSTGAFYRLLQRTHCAAGRALCLRNASIEKGLITGAEWDTLRDPLQSCIRVLTLVPVDIAVKAMAVFGETDRSAALIRALGFDRPSEWGQDKAGEEEGEEEHEEEGNAQQDDDWGLVRGVRGALGGS